MDCGKLTTAMNPNSSMTVSLQTTTNQIAAARSTLILRLAIQKWREKTAQRTDLINRVTALENTRRLRSALRIWTQHLQEKKRADWRLDMRAKLKAVRQRREIRVLKDAWAKWRQSYRSHLAGLDYDDRLVRKMFDRWKTGVLQVDGLYLEADAFKEQRHADVLEKIWDTWKVSSQLRSIERLVVARSRARILRDAVSVWQHRTLVFCFLRRI